MTIVQQKRPEWMPTQAEMREVWDRLALREATWGEAYDALSMLTARRIAEWFDLNPVFVPSRHCADACASVINRFIREGKGESE